MFSGKKNLRNFYEFFFFNYSFILAFQLGCQTLFTIPWIFFCKMLKIFSFAILGIILRLKKIYKIFFVPHFVTKATDFKSIPQENWIEIFQKLNRNMLQDICLQIFYDLWRLLKKIIFDKPHKIISEVFKMIQHKDSVTFFPEIRKI